MTEFLFTAICVLGLAFWLYYAFVSIMVAGIDAVTKEEIERRKRK